MTAPDGPAADDRATRRKERRKARELWWIALGGWLVISALAKTWRIRVHGREEVDRHRALKRPLVFAFWHGQMLPLLYQHRDEGVAILISSHRDGEIIARIGERFGFRSIRGSSTRGAARALLGLVRELQGGGEVAVTPDGPRGPAKVFAPGAVAAAARADAPIALVAARPRRAWHLGSWDSFAIPKPFTRVDVYYSPLADAGSVADSPARATALGPELDALGEDA